MDMRHDQFENGYVDPPYFERMETSEYMELQESRRINEVCGYIYKFNIIS
jgi:hypothetical protein